MAAAQIGPTDARVWDAIVSTLELDPEFDHDGAVRVADQVAALVERGKKYDRAAVRARRLRASRDWGLVLAFLAAAAAGIALFVSWQIRVHADDYASVTPGDVAAVGYYYIRSWYGQNDLPNGLVEVSQTHSQADGRRAWLTRWRSSAGTEVCAYVWGGGTGSSAPHGDYGRVGACP